MKVGELKKFLEATDDEVEIMLTVVRDNKAVHAMATAVQDADRGVIQIKGGET